MAEIDKAIVEETEAPDTEEVDVELEDSTTEKDPSELEMFEAVEDFYKNIAEEMDEDVLQRMSNQLLDDYKKDRVSRKDWETSYTNNLDLLGIRHVEMTRPFKGSASVTCLLYTSPSPRD